MFRKNFIKGIINTDSDERLLGEGEARELRNVEVINSEGSDVGAINNSLSTKQLTYIDLGTNAKTIGQFSDEPKDKIYWFVKSDLGTFLLEWNDINKTVSIVLKDTRTEDSNRVLNLKEDKLITGIWKVISEDSKKDLLIWTDDNIEPCCINIERAKTYGENGFEESDIFLIKPQPLYAPVTIPTYSAEKSNYIEERFLTFAYRYKYLDGERSALSSYSNYNFNPKKFKIDYQSMENIGMVNNFNAIKITFNTGPKQVTDIEIIAKESNSNALALIVQFNKEKEGWSHNQDREYIFSNNKLYEFIDESELFRTFDNVPRKAKAFALIGNIPVFGNYTEGNNLNDVNGNEIKMHYDVSIQSNDIKGTVLVSSINIDKDKFTINIPSNINLKKGNRLILDIDIEEYTYNGNYIDSLEFILPTNFNNCQELAANEDFIFFVGTLMTNRFKASLTIDIPANYAQTGETPFSIDSSTSTTIVLNSIALNYTIDNSPDPDTFETVNFFFSSSASANYNTLESFASCKTNMDYEVGIIYQDKWTRKTTVLTSVNNTVNIPLSLSTLQNKLLINIYNPAPYFAETYKIVVKSPNLHYHTIYATVFYPEGLFRWVKLEGANRDKVKEGDILIVKSDLSGPLQNVIKTRVIEISNQPKNFIENNKDEDDNDIVEQGGLYMKIKPSGYNMGFSENTIVNEDQFRSAGKNRQEKFTNNAIFSGFFGDNTKITNWKNTTDNNALKKPAIVSNKFNVFDSSGVFSGKLPIIAGSKIDFYLRVYEDGIGTVGEFDKEFIVSSAHEDIKSWWEEEVVDLGGQSDNFDINFEEGIGGEIRILIQGNNTGSPADRKQSKLEVKINAILVEGIMIFETDPKQSEQSIFYETEQTFKITNGLHEGNIQNQTSSLSANIELDFFNCFVQGNGAESFRVKDSANSNFLNIDLKPTTTSIETYKETRRFADLIYGEPFVESTNFNGLNAFNQSKINFKELDKQYGSIQRLFSRDTNLVVIKEDKTSYILFGKDLISMANGVSFISKTPEILGQEVHYAGDNGIGLNPESLAWDAYRIYYVNPRRGTPIRLSIDGTSEINYGRVGFFRDLFINNPTSKKLGGFDPYHNKYVLTYYNEEINTPILSCGNTVSKIIDEPFSYILSLNNLLGDIILQYSISGGNVTIQAVFNNVINTATNVTGSGTLTIDRDTLSQNTINVLITPVSGSPVAQVINVCPIGSPMNIITIVLADMEDIGTTITNRFNIDGGQFFGSIHSFESEGISQYILETGLEGVGKYPSDGQNVIMQSFKSPQNTGLFDANKFNRLGYLVSNTLYTSSQIQTIVDSATFIPTSKTNLGINSEINSGNFTFNRPTSNHNLYLIFDYEDKSISCSAGISANGNRGIYEITVTIGTDIGNTGIDFNSFGVPDRFQIEYNGVIVADSKYNGSSLTGSPPNYLGLIGTHANIPVLVYNGTGFVATGELRNFTVSQADVVNGTTEPISANGTITFNKTTAYPTTMKIIATGVFEGTEWTISGICPTP